MDRRLPAVGQLEVVEVPEDPQLRQKWAGDVGFCPVAGFV